MDHKYEDTIELIKSCNSAKQTILSKICRINNQPENNDFDIDEHIRKRKLELGTEKRERQQKRSQY